MIIYGYDGIAPLLELEGYQFKMPLNEIGVVLFPCTTEHRDATQPGIHCADDYQGNALAAMVKPGRIEFRYHGQFSDQRVKQLVARMLNLPELDSPSKLGANSLVPPFRGVFSHAENISTKLE